MILKYLAQLIILCIISLVTISNRYGCEFDKIFYFCYTITRNRHRTETQIGGNIMPQIAIEIKPEQIEQAFRQMNEQTRKKLIDNLLAEEFDFAVKKLRQNIKKNKVTQRDINRICEDVRQELYEKRCR